MKTIKAKLHYSDNNAKSYIELSKPHINSDGTIVKQILSENIGLVKNDMSMDMPISYCKMNSFSLKTLEKNDFNCHLELDDLGNIRKINNLVVILP